MRKKRQTATPSHRWTKIAIRWNGTARELGDRLPGVLPSKVTIAAERIRKRPAVLVERQSLLDMISELFEPA